MFFINFEQLELEVLFDFELDLTIAPHRRLEALLSPELDFFSYFSFTYFSSWPAG